MSTHGRGPRFVLVKRYARWQLGKRLTVKKYLRGLSPGLSIRPSSKQLKLDLEERSGSA
jgi:hypothetical protein